MRSLYFVISLISFIVISAFSQTREEMVAKFKEHFKAVIVDVRGSRGGNGDVAAGYLTIMDFIQNYQITEGITILVDSGSLKIIERLAKGNSRFWSIAKVETIETLPTDRVFDLYLSLSSPSGSFQHGKQISERWGDENQVEKNDDTGKKINIRTEGVLMAQTALGNTEETSTNPFAAVRSNGLNFDMSPAGIASNEAGIYNDYVAVQLRSMNVDEIEKFVVTESKMIDDFDSKTSVQDIISGNKLKGVKTGLAYGISAKETKQQFMSYLKGLEAGKSFCLITPSIFDEHDIVDPELRRRVVLVSNNANLSEHAEPGKIYIVKTKTLPHRVFVGLMAYSMRKGLVPVGAGDGFMSAAINLGGPFVLTKVPWNAKNIDNLKQRLLIITKRLYTDPTHIALVESLFESVYGKIDMLKSQALHKLAPLFARLSKEVPNLSERIIETAIVAHEAAKSNLDPNERAHLVKNIHDQTLRKSIEDGGIAGTIKTTYESGLVFSSTGGFKDESGNDYKKNDMAINPSKNGMGDRTENFFNKVSYDKPTKTYLHGLETSKSKQSKPLTLNKCIGFYKN
ncbi:MAG: hypothetical protein L6Q37_08205 [Bdellovibrionaceae bacterium]|nr:hypothetical protein [Pseudobdellovibrionaceae bacterium]NUM60502.1 hypothetical protein [Pseudobdellovibrionaceae bacterium]